MARDKEAIQDRLLKQMEAQNRRTGNQRDVPTAEEEMAAFQAFQNMSPDQQRASLPFSEYIERVRNLMIREKMRYSYGAKSFNFVSLKQRAALEKMHSEGRTYAEVASFYMDHELDYMNR